MLLHACFLQLEEGMLKEQQKRTREAVPAGRHVPLPVVTKADYARYKELIRKREP